jgi:uncharacterized membrane protein YphA (DoxX/SURF4 family)
MWKALLRFGYSSSAFFLGLIFFTSGMAKLFWEHRFPGIMGPVWLEDKLTAYDLGLFVRFIGYAQVLIGFLLLTLRFTTLGAVALVPMLLNIFIITISQHWQGTPYVIAFFFLLNLYLLFYDQQKLWPFVTEQPAPQEAYRKTLSNSGNGIWAMGLLLVLISPTISYWSSVPAYVLAGSGMGFGWWSNRFDVVRW